jgi:hypothetical protein
MALQKTWVDRMLYLVQLGYTTPVLKFFGGMGRDLDDSLIVHFVKKVNWINRAVQCLDNNYI